MSTLNEKIVKNLESIYKVCVYSKSIRGWCYVAIDENNRHVFHLETHCSTPLQCINKTAAFVFSFSELLLLHHCYSPFPCCGCVA